MTEEVFYEMFIKEPYEKGFKKGYKEGYEKSVHQGKIENAISLLKNGVSIEIITKSLKITKEDLKLMNIK